MSKPSASTVSATLAGLAAGMLAFGAVQIAMGKDLVSKTVPGSALAAPAGVQQNVNRAAKSDRLAMTTSREGGTTLSFRVPSLPNTLIVTRFSADAASPRQDGNAARPSAERRAVACEPSVSVLAEVAKLLGPSRCIT